MSLFAVFPLGLVGLALVGAAVQLFLARAERRRFPAPGVLVDIGGYRLHLNVTGRGGENGVGPTIVLDSALAGSSLSWDGIQRRLSERARVVSYDRAGFGWSDPAPTPRGVGEMVDELHAALALASLPRPYVLVGHSYGGWIAQLFAQRFRSEVSGLVLVDVPHPRTWATPDAFQRRRVADGARTARRGALLARFGVTRLIFRLVASRRLAVGDAKVASLLEKIPKPLRATLRTFWVRPETLSALASLIEHAPESATLVAASLADLGDLRLRVLTASNPDEARRADQEAILALSRSARHIVAANSGHWIPLDEPDVVVAAVEEVLST